MNTLQSLNQLSDADLARMQNEIAAVRNQREATRLAAEAQAAEEHKRKLLGELAELEKSLKVTFNKMTEICSENNIEYNLYIADMHFEFQDGEWVNSYNY